MTRLQTLRVRPPAPGPLSLPGGRSVCRCANKVLCPPPPPGNAKMHLDTPANFTNLVIYTTERFMLLFRHVGYLKTNISGNYWRLFKSQVFFLKYPDDQYNHNYQPETRRQQKCRRI